MFITSSSSFPHYLGQFRLGVWVCFGLFVLFCFAGVGWFYWLMLYFVLVCFLAGRLKPVTATKFLTPWNHCTEVSCLCNKCFSTCALQKQGRYGRREWGVRKSIKGGCEALKCYYNPRPRKSCYFPPCTTFFTKVKYSLPRSQKTWAQTC